MPGKLLSLAFSGWILYLLFTRIRNSKLNPVNQDRGELAGQFDEKLSSFVINSFLLLCAGYGYYRVDSSIKIRDSAGPLLLGLVGAFVGVILGAIFGSFVWKTLNNGDNPTARRLRLIVCSVGIIILYGLALSQCAPGPRH